MVTSAEQPPRLQQSRLAPFFLKKMTNILEQFTFRDGFLAGAKMLCSPTNQMAVPAPAARARSLFYI